MPSQKNFIVYKITNKINGKVYIGQTTETLEKRWKRHCGYQLNDGTYFHNAIKKYGADNFSVELLAEANNQLELDEKEFYYIDLYKSNSYNSKFEKGKCGGDTLSKNKNLDEIKQKLSLSKLKGKNPHSRKVKMKNILTGEEKIFESMSECQEYLSIDRHDIISRRCLKKIRKPFKDIYTFDYC